MNEETFIAISGITLVVVFAVLPMIALQIIVYKLYLKFRAAKEKVRLENQPEGIEVGEKPSLPAEPVSPRWMTFKFIGATLQVVITSLAYGIVFSVVSQLFYLVFVFPLALGWAVGSLVAGAARKAKLRGASQMLVLSVLAAVAVYGTFHYSRYVAMQAQMSFELAPALSEATEEEKLVVGKAVLDYGLKEETGYSGFLGYMLYRAKEGISVGRFYSSNRVNLGPILTVAYWLLEFGIIFGITWRMGKNRIRGAFCEVCGNWYGAEKHLGGTASANESLVRELIRKKDFAGLGELLEANADVPSLEVYYQGCQVCGQSQSQLVVRRAFQNGKGTLQFSDTVQTVLQPRESSLLLRQLSPAPVGD